MPYCYYHDVIDDMSLRSRCVIFIPSSSYIPTSQYYVIFHTLSILRINQINMKYSPTVSSSRRKSRKAHFTAHSEARRTLMSANLSKELQARHGVRSMPIRKDDEVIITRGMYKTREGKVTACFRKKFVVHVERITREKANGATVQVGIPASSLTITKLKMDKDRKAALDRKNRNKKGSDVEMTNVD